MPETSRKVEIIAAAAKFIFDEARVLIGCGAGQDEAGNDLGFEGELDNIPSDTETYRWASAVVRFLQYIAQHIGPAIAEYQEREDADRWRAFLEITNTIQDSENT